MCSCSAPLSVCLSVCLSVHLSICLSVCLSIHLVVCLSVCLSVCLQLKALYPGEQDNYTVELCFDGHLMWTTLISGLNFSRSAASKWTVVFESKVSLSHFSM